MAIPVSQPAVPISELAVEANLSTAFYAQMYVIRKVEQQFLDLYAKGLLFGTVHTSMGQEACDVGVINALDRSKDVIFSNHRAHGQFITYSSDIDGLIAELLGRPDGVCAGIGGTQHLHTHNLYTNGIQGGIVPNAVGAALAEKLKESGAVTVVFLGDGSMGEGVVYESMNIASLWSLPVIFLLEDNGIAQTTPGHLAHAGNLSTRAESFGIEWDVVDADDVLKIYTLACAIVEKVRSTSRPFYLHAHTLRLGPHSKGDDTRSPEELEALREKDPLQKLAGEIPLSVRQQIEADVDARVEYAVRQAIDSHSPVR